MPPKKKLKTGNAMAKAIASGEQAVAGPTTMSSVSPLLQAVQTCVESMYSLRHAGPEVTTGEALPSLPRADSGYVWPVGVGGTFKDIAQRAWQSPEKLVDESFDMVLAAGLLDEGSTVETFKAKYCTLQEWPPAVGSTFETGILMWSFKDNSFWRGKHIAMSEIVGIARAIAITRFREGELVSLRLPATSEQVDACCDGENVALGTLLFADGSQKTLAAFTVWLALLLVWRDFKDSIEDPHVVQLIASLLVLQTTYKSMDANASSMQSAIGKIVKQNADSKVQPVSSLTWCSILSALQDDSDGTINFDTCMEAYNDHPEVRAWSDNANETGAGSISLDRRRKRAVKNWLEKTAKDAFRIVETSTHDIPFSMGPFGESMAAYQFLFLGSTASGLAVDHTCDLRPLDKEPFIPIDWTLPMSELAQTILFKRIVSAFNRETSMVAATSKKKYRLSMENAQSLRNMVCLFAQLYPHLQSRLPAPHCEKWLEEFSNSALHDEDMRFLLESAPASVALSMLPSSKAAAQEQAHQKEQTICLAVEKQRLDVISAHWTYFKSGLERDQVLLEKVKDVPQKIAAKLHQKRVKQTMAQAKQGEAAVAGYADKYLRVVHVPRVEHSNAEISDMRDLVATQLQSKETTKSCEALFFAGDFDVFCEAFLWVKRLGGIPHPRIRTFLLLSMMVAKPLCKVNQWNYIKKSAHDLVEERPHSIKTPTTQFESDGLPLDIEVLDLTYDTPREVDLLEGAPAAVDQVQQRNLQALPSPDSQPWEDSHHPYGSPSPMLVDPEDTIKKRCSPLSETVPPFKKLKVALPKSWEDPSVEVDDFPATQVDFPDTLVDTPPQQNEELAKGTEPASCVNSTRGENNVVGITRPALRRLKVFFL